MHEEILEHFDDDEKLSRTPGALNFLAIVKPRSELLRRRCISAITEEGTSLRDSDASRRAVFILEEQFEDRKQIGAEIADKRPPFQNVVLALAALDSDHPYVRQIVAAITNHEGVPLSLLDIVDRND